MVLQGVPCGRVGRCRFLNCPASAGHFLCNEILAFILLRFCGYLSPCVIIRSCFTSSRAANGHDSCRTVSEFPVPLCIALRGWISASCRATAGELLSAIGYCRQGSAPGRLSARSTFTGGGAFGPIPEGHCYRIVPWGFRSDVSIGRLPSRESCC